MLFRIGMTLQYTGDVFLNNIKYWFVIIQINIRKIIIYYASSVCTRLFGIRESYLSKVELFLNRFYSS